MRRTVAVLVGALGTRLLGAQAPADGGARLYPLIEIGVARAFPATLAERSVSGTFDGAPDYETMRLRLEGQWGILAEGRVPLGEAQVWGIELYGARFRGRARYSATRGNPGSALPVTPAASIDSRLGGVTSWRGTLGVVRAVPIVGRLTGALLVGGTYGTVRGRDAACTSTSCPPVIRLTTPGVTVGGDVFTPEWRGLRFRLALKGDVLSVDEAEVRRSARWAPFRVAPFGEGDRQWRFLPSATVGLEFKIPL